MTNEKALREQSVGKLLVSLSLPVILIMVVQVLYNMADVFFLGRSGDPLQVAGVSLAMPVFAVFSAFNTLIGFGGSTAASLALGSGEKQRGKQYSAFVLYAGLGLGVLMGIAVMLFLQPLLRLLGTDTQTAAYTGSYLKIMAAGAPFAVAGGAMSNVVRADGDGKSAVISHMSGTVLNIILDPIFISLLGWGVVGAGLATLLGNLLSFILLFAVIRNKNNFSVSARDFTLRPEISLHVLSLGFPMAASTLLSSFSSVFANRLLVRYGNEAVAAQSIAGKAGMLIAMIVMGICMGMQPAISYTCGRRDRRRMRSILLGTGTASVATATVLAVIFFLGRDSFVRAFLNNGEILALGRRMILGGLAAAPFVGVYQLCSVYLQSTGRVAYATVTALMQKGLVYVPVLYGMNAAFGLTGLIFSAAVTDVVSMLAAVALCMKSAKQF